MSMTYSEATREDVIVAITDAISGALQAGRRVLWLVSGGSLIPLQRTVMERLGAQGSCSGLAIVQADERYGEPGHTDSNWQKLHEAGFAPADAAAVPALCGLPFSKTVARYDALLHRALEADNVYAIGCFGIGADGHTAGILPGSTAVTASDLATGFNGPDFQRITITPVCIARLDLAIAYASGVEKQVQVKRLHRRLSLRTQPAQALKRAREARIYHD